ncbi:T9SS type A sorting domain-containing protein [Psychroserpens sp. SPM9]|uniref:T9SS type A sorting domain-containing protein n=1 Tax=Psychroserpens sp. SPM9 TaxID=2975598 RepID=UPI0021A5ECF8|nr:T9SS type A sorting domain-containing protein [Psychroserpens sp. SPM9]MDG5492171.1 T9SS type A sorting domain-containing protein [Psychroserpens sp. SPM9]
MKKITFLKLPTFKMVSILLICLNFSSYNVFAVNPQSDSDSGDTTMKIRLKFDSANSFTRKIVVIADDNATAGYDSDFDESLETIQEDDMFWMIDQGKFLNQGIAEFNEGTIMPIGIHTNSNGLHFIAIDKLDNIPSTMNIFVHDKDLGVFHNIKEGAYQVNLTAGQYTDRFEITFKQHDTLGTTEFNTQEKSIDILFDVASDQIKVLNHSNSKIEAINVYSILGQTVYKNNNASSNNEIRIEANRMTTGTYIVIIKSETGITSKKILVN